MKNNIYYWEKLRVAKSMLKITWTVQGLRSDTLNWEDISEHDTKDEAIEAGKFRAKKTGLKLFHNGYEVI